MVVLLVCGCLSTTMMQGCPTRRFVRFWRQCGHRFMIGPIASDAIDPTETLARISYCRSEAVQPLSRRARLGAYRCLNCDNLYACTGQIPRRRGISTIGMAI